MLFAGWNPQLHMLNDTWEWDGTNWTRITTGTNVPARDMYAMAYDTARGRVVLFGGIDSQSQTLGDTWEYCPHDLAASVHLVSVATGGKVKLALYAGSAHGGKSYMVLGCFDIGLPRGILLGNGRVNLLLHPDPYFRFTLQHPNPLIAGSHGTLDAGGNATATIKVPKLPAVFIGTRFYHAYIVFKTRIDYASTPVPLELVK